MLVVVLARDGRHEVEPTRPAEARRASPAEAAAALASFVQGVAGRDPKALEQLAPRDLPGAVQLMREVATNVGVLDLTAVSARYVEQVGAVASDGSWSGVVELTWQLRGFDEEPARSNVVVRFAPDGDGLDIAGFGAAARDDSRLPLWLRDRLSVVRSDNVLAMVDGPRDEAQAVHARAVRGIEVVRRVLSDWTASVVVEVAATGAELEETLGAQPGTYAGIAAVTAPVGDDSDPDGPVHVFVNPDVSDGLRRVGAQVVMSHELVHVATDAVRRPVEPWLLEGFADYVALRDTGLPNHVTLGRAIEAVRRDGVPDALPPAADFNAHASDLQASYEAARLACRIIAERLGERGLAMAYQKARADSPIARVLRGAGSSVNETTRIWKSELRRLSLQR